MVGADRDSRGVEAAGHGGEVDVVLGGRIKQLRQARMMSQTELGERVGVSFQQIQKYENGSNRLSAAALLRVSQALQASPGERLQGFQTAEPREIQRLPAGTPLSDELLTAFSNIGSMSTRAGLLHLARILASDGRQLLAESLPPEPRPRRRRRSG